MGRRSFNRKPKLSLIKAIKRSKNIYIKNISVNEIFEVIDNNSPESEAILRNIMIACICMMIKAQITISARPKNVEYVDKLPSTKQVNRKFLTSEYGRTLAASTGIAASFPYLLQDKSMQEDLEGKIIQIVVDMVDNPSPNVKRIRPTIEEWPKYAKGEAGAALGQIISCPSTNFKSVNIDPTVQNFGIIEAIESIGIKNETLEKYKITPESLAETIKGSYLVDERGIPITTIEYDEPNIIKSKIQQEILGDCLIRKGNVGTKVVKGMEPDASITKAVIEKYLNPKEVIAYKFAINTGDKNILRKYTDLIKSRASEDKGE